MKSVRTQYVSTLTAQSHKCNHFGKCQSLSFYCEIIEIHTAEQGDYTIAVKGDIEMFEYAYEIDFNLFDLDENMIEAAVSNPFYNRFEIVLRRKMNTSFILVVTTEEMFGQGVFSIIVNGPSNVSMQPISMCSFFLFFDAEI